MSAHSFVQRLTVLGACVGILSSCAAPVLNNKEMTPTFAPKPASQVKPSEAVIVGNTTVPKQKIEPGPPPPVTAPSSQPHNLGTPPSLAHGEAEALSLEQVSLPAFIDEVFSKTLKLTVQVDPQIASRTDLVTLRTGTTLPADELFVMAQKILAGYGIAVSWDGSVLHVMTDAAMMAEMPSLIRSRALPELPVALRPIFQFVNLHQVSQSDMILWLENAFGSKIRLFQSPKTNSVMIFGLPANVSAAVEAVHILDQARLAGRRSLRIAPVYWTADAFAAKLAEVLRAEGYDANTSSGQIGPLSAIMIIPVESDNSVIAFAADPAVLQHVRQWATDLDQPARADPLRSVFVYAVQNTTAESLGSIIQNVLSGANAQHAAAQPTEARLEQAGQTGALASTGQAAGAATAAAAQAQGNSGGLGGPTEGGGPRIVIDKARNSLIFVGTAQQYQSIRPLLEALDKAPREALIEVTVAEITLDDSTNLGVEWTLMNHIGKGMTQSLGTGANVNLGDAGTGGGLSVGTTGFNYAILNSASQVRLLLNAFAQNDHLSVLSTPRVLAKSGGTASIKVGTEVPVVTSQATTSSVSVGGNSGILQSIEYQQTGVLLTVSPVVHSSNRIDLSVSQEVSAALPNTTPGISSPLIQNRDISTQLSLADGSTVVIGGMIQDSRTNDNTGVPFFKDIPGLGLLFRNQSVSRTKTELLVFITPYVVSTDSDAARITKDFEDQMSSWPIPSANLQW